MTELIGRARHRIPVAALLATVVACGGSGSDMPAPPSVTIATPERRDVRNVQEFTGTTRAIEFAEIRARVSGTLDEMFFTPSSFVNAGDVLFEIERAPYRAAYREAEASLTSAGSELTRAESDLERIKLAIQSDAVSQQDLDRAQATRDQADAAVQAARARFERARLDLGYSRVTTPVSGQVSRNFVDLGNLVGAREPTLLTTVTRIDPIFVYFNAPEDAVLRALQDLGDGERRSADLEVLVATAADEGFPHRGAIDYIDNTVDPATGTIEVRAVIDNSELVLFPGLFVRVRAIGRLRPNTILVHERAVGTDLNGKFVLLVGGEDVVEQRYVTLGPRQDDGSIVVESGLDGGERYVTNGMLRARPGFPVTPQTEAEAAAAAGSARQAADGS